MPGYKKTNLDFTNLPNWLSYLKDDLALNAIGLTVIRLPAGKGYTFMHQHKEQEEVYIVIDGKGIIHINGDDIPLFKGDFINVFPNSKRALKASEDSDLVYICAGAVKSEKYPNDKTKKTLINDGIPDFENLPPWYVGNKKIAELNKRLKNDRKAKK
jgi:mannose-6-phosphate isomerase-like protein (cupin superfamily)